MNVKRFLVTVLIAAPLAMAIPASAQVRLGGGGPSCSTFNAAGRTQIVFDRSDVVVVKGRGFAKQSLVLVTFAQRGAITALARVRTDDAGAFATSPSLLKVPSDAADGNASLRLSDGSGVATCALTIDADAPAVSTGRANLLLALWTTGLLAFGVFLVVMTVRQWRERRLREALTRMGGEPREESGARTTAPRQEPQPEFTEPPVLPVGWDRGREPRPKRPDADDGRWTKP